MSLQHMKKQFIVQNLQSPDYQDIKNELFIRISFGVVEKTKFELIKIALINRNFILLVIQTILKYNL